MAAAGAGSSLAHGAGLSKDAREEVASGEGGAFSKAAQELGSWQQQGFGGSPEHGTVPVQDGPGGSPPGGTDANEKEPRRWVDGSGRVWEGGAMDQQQ